METAPLTHGEQQPTTVGRYAWQCGTHAERVGSEHQLAFSELMCVGIERLAINVVFELLIAKRYFWQVDAVGLIFETGTAVVEPSAVGSPTGECLQFVRTVLDGFHLVAVNVVDDEVALTVNHFYLVQVGGVEGLHRLVGTVGYESLGGMPGRVNRWRTEWQGAPVYLFHFPVVGYKCATVGLTGMQLHALRIPLLIAVAVDTLSARLSGAEHVVGNDLLVEILQTALVDGQFFVGDV